MRAQLLWEKFQFWKKTTSDKELKQEKHLTKNYKTGKKRQNNKKKLIIIIKNNIKKDKNK